MISITICSQRKRSFPEIKYQHYRGVIQGLNNHASITTQWRIEVHPKKKDKIDQNWSGGARCAPAPTIPSLQ